MIIDYYLMLLIEFILCCRM